LPNASARRKPILDGIVLNRNWAGEVRNVSLLVAIGANESGYREILGICEGAKEDKTDWRRSSSISRNAG
jgi:transposase-like protein